jgi:hypothetical protein
MMPFSKARRIAETWVDVMMEGTAEIVREAVQAKPYGWIFYYQSSAYLRDRSDMSNALAGNAPFIIDRTNGGLHVLGTGQNFDIRLAAFEKTVPDAVLMAKPESPNW